MSIFSLPTTVGVSRSRFGLTSNTQVFRSPLTGQTQTLERPGARWFAEYSLPPMKRAAVAEWQSFLAKLRGGAGRFYGYDPDAKTPRGLASMMATGSRNALRNGNAVGAVNGVENAGGQLPTNWAWGTVNGVTRQVVGSGVENGIHYVDVRFYGTPSGTTSSLNFESTKAIAAFVGETWVGSLSYRLVAGALTNIAGVYHRVEQVQASGAVLNSVAAQLTSVDATWRRFSQIRTLATTTPDTAFVRSGLYVAVTAGLAIDVTLRLGHVQLEKASAATVYIPTTGSARSRDSGARVEGSGQSGTTLATWNWQPSVSTLLRAGDYVAFDTPQGRSLHMVVADVASDTEGRAVLTLEPPLRNALEDNAAVLVQSASCVMALVDDSVSWEADAAGTYRLTFSAEERFS